MSMRYQAAIMKPGFNPLGTQTTTTYYDLYTWGANSQGQLGLNNTSNYSSPKQVGSATYWSIPVSGCQTNLAITV